MWKREFIGYYSRGTAANFGKEFLYQRAFNTLFGPMVSQLGFGILICV